MNSKVYVHQVVEIEGTNRSAYVAMVANRAEKGAGRRAGRLVGVFAAVPSTGYWHRTFEVWEYEGWSALAENIQYLRGISRDKAAEESQWQEKASRMRFGGQSRVMLPAEWSPSLDKIPGSDHKAGCYEHQVVNLRQGAAAAYLERAGRRVVPIMSRYGAVVVGAWRTALVDEDEVILLWAHRSWKAWGAFERESRNDEELRAWRLESGDCVLDYRSTILFSAPATAVP